MADGDRPIAEGRRAAEELAPSDPEDLGGQTYPEILPTREPWRSIVHMIGVAEQIIGATLLVAILLLVLGGVALRYLPLAIVPWTGEIAGLAMVWLTFVMAGYLAAHDRHISIQVVDYVLGGRALAAVKLFVDIVVLATCVTGAVAVYLLVSEDIGQVTPAAQLPLRLVNLVPLIGFTLTALRAAIAIGVRDLPAAVGRTEVAA